MVKTATPKRRQKWLGYSQNVDKPKHYNTYSFSDAYIIDRRLYTYMACNC